MPKADSTGPKPVVKPTAPLLVGLIVLWLAAGLALLLLGSTRPHTVGAYFFLALLGATVTFGLLGATGMVKTRRFQMGGSAGVFGTILIILLQFVEAPTSEVKGTVLVDGVIASKATVVLLETDQADNTREIQPANNGQFRFTVPGKRKAYKFRIIIPGLGETNLVVDATGEWLNLRVDSRASIRPVNPELERHLDLCKAEKGSCTLFLFDYLRDHVSNDELEAFQNFQAYRLDTGIRNYLSAQNLLKEIEVRVRRCSEVEIKEPALASRVASMMDVPAVMWGFLTRTDDQLKSASSVTLVDDQPINLHMRETLGSDVTELLGLEHPVHGAPLAIASFLIGDAYLKEGRNDLARRALLHARTLANEMQPPDRDFEKAVDRRLQRLQALNPASELTPIGGM